MKQPISVWDRLAKMKPEDRKKYLETDEKPRNTGIWHKKAFGSAVYRQLELVSPPDGWFVYEDPRMED